MRFRPLTFMAPSWEGIHLRKSTVGARPTSGTPVRQGCSQDLPLSHPGRKMWAVSRQTPSWDLHSSSPQPPTSLLAPSPLPTFPKILPHQALVETNVLVLERDTEREGSCPQKGHKSHGSPGCQSAVFYCGVGAPASRGGYNLGAEERGLRVHEGSKGPTASPPRHAPTLARALPFPFGDPPPP